MAYVETVGSVGAKLYNDRQIVENFVERLPTTTKIVVTGMKGPSLWAEEHARLHLLTRPKVLIIPAAPGGGKWSKEEYIEHTTKRNLELLSMVGLVMAFWDGQDSNTRDIICRATAAKMPVFIIPEWEPGALSEYHREQEITFALDYFK